MTKKQNLQTDNSLFIYDQFDRVLNISFFQLELYDQNVFHNLLTLLFYNQFPNQLYYNYSLTKNVVGLYVPFNMMSVPVSFRHFMVLNRIS